MHHRWLKNEPTYTARFEETDKECTRILEDRAFRNERDGRPAYFDGKKLYKFKYDTALLMKLLASRDRRNYGEQNPSNGSGMMGD
jgi:hypothetical protein